MEFRKGSPQSFPRFYVGVISDERRGAPEKNEDQLAYKEDEQGVLAGVFDGATALGDVEYFRKLGKTPGRMAAEIAKETFLNTPIGVRPQDVILAINRALREKAAELPVEDKIKAELFTTMGLVASLDKASGILSFAAMGDCLLIHMTASGEFTWYTDEKAAEFERREIENAINVSQRKRKLMTEMLKDEDVVSVLLKHRRLEDAPDGNGYGALKGVADEIVSKYIRIGEMRFAPGDKAFLMTDGMLISPLNSDKEREIIEEALKSGGLKVLLRKIREIQEEDAALQRFPRLKQYDDASGVELSAI